MRHKEIEVKFLIEDLAAMRQRLMALGAMLTTPRMYEENLLFDTPDVQFRRQGRLLRLRHDRRKRITYTDMTFETFQSLAIDVRACHFR